MFDIESGCQAFLRIFSVAFVFSAILQVLVTGDGLHLMGWTFVMSFASIIAIRYYRQDFIDYQLILPEPVPIHCNHADDWKFSKIRWGSPWPPASVHSQSSHQRLEINLSVIP